MGERAADVVEPTSGLDGTDELDPTDQPTPPSAPTPPSRRERTGSFAADVVAWFDANARDLPWRQAGTTPWAVLVSEFMLQQTPVERVRPAWAEWLRRWPTPAGLAADSPGEAIRMWGKLGYPRRALRLHAAAAAIVERHGGEVPDDVEALLALPGVGAYTARAVAAFAFGQRHPVVDTNVRRLFARAIEGRAMPGLPSATRDHAVVGAELPAEPARAARFSAAAMELGALVCRARATLCEECPVRLTCRWRLAGYPADDGPRRPAQRFTGTDRQVRGRLLDVLRSADGPVQRGALDLAWPEPVQRDRALGALIVDGLVTTTADGRFTLPT